MATENGRVGMLVDLNRCTGCYSCQAACRQVNGFSYDEKWLKVIRQNPEPIDGKLRMIHLPVPLALEKCAECIARESPPLCSKVCLGNALFVAPVEKLVPMLEKKHTMLFTP
jgi:Fe-S-cluster-containing dehydrogenase component